MFVHHVDPNETKYLSALQETVIQQRYDALQRDASRLAKQRAFLREERRKARLEEAAISAEKDNLEFVKKHDWWPDNHLKGAGDPLSRLKLRVGGQNFEISKELLCQDKESLLNALCQEGSPAIVDKDEAEEGDVRQETVVVDRDWWLFRLIVTFLRDGLVPGDRYTALQLYREAAFWRLDSLQRAIEETHLNLQRTDIKFNDEGCLSSTKLKDEDKFWKQKKNWWEAQPEPKPEPPPPKPADWWLDGGGESMEKEVERVHSTTWGYKMNRR
jgi:hypothetical protein